ncbi:MAG: HAD family hydrolase [Gemmatimonadales bacterium]|nr:HAD family hydrolase [Gemmatimonadales bacterium]
MAEQVGRALGLPLTGEQLAAGAGAAALAMERTNGADRERAAAYLEALFLEVGIAPGRMEEVRHCLYRMHGERHLWCSVAADTGAALDRLRQAGLRLGIISNSDGRVAAALEASGLRHHFDVVVDSALVGVEKPDPAIFRAALEALEVAPGEALYVGDLYQVDVLGARAAGMDAVLLAPAGAGAGECRAVSSIGELADDLLQGGLC